MIEAAGNRIDKYIEDYIEVYRIGADEFVVLTKCMQEEEVLGIVNKNMRI